MLIISDLIAKKITCIRKNKWQGILLYLFKEETRVLFHCVMLYHSFFNKTKIAIYLYYGHRSTGFDSET